MRFSGLHSATWLFALALGVLAIGCTENFGTPPLDPGGRIAVPAEEPAGPPPFNVAAQSLAGTDGRLWLGLERGLYHVLPGSWRWWPGHPGFTPNNSPSIPSAIRMVDVDPSGRVSLHVSRSGTIDVLFASVDGGETFRELEIPNLIIGTVDAVAALAPSDVYPGGGFLVAQGAAIYVRALSSDWTRATLPDTPRTVRAAAGGRGGHVVVGVEGPDGSPHAWISYDGGQSFVDAGLDDGLGADVLDVAVSDDGEVGVATRDEVVGPAATAVSLSGSFDRIDLRFAGQRLRYAGLTIQAKLQIGRAEPADTPLEIDPPDGIAALLVTDGEVYLTTNPGAEVWCLEGSQLTSREFGGRSLAMTAVAADSRSPGSVYLGHLSGDVFFGDPAHALIDLDGPSPSIPRALLADTGSSAGVFSGNFGVQLIESNTPGAPWVDRSEGQFTLTPEVFGGPVTVQELVASPTSGQHLWLGSQLGDGPYESLNGGLLWVRAEGGLGVPPPFQGFPAVTQVRAFAFAEDETWMGSFRGGVWSLSESRAWEQSNRGLPDINGVVLDTCCFDPPDPEDIFAPTPTEVDVRDLVALENGTLLAATGWGIFRDESRQGDWQESFSGLTNFDVFALAPHPDRPQWVVAAARGNADNADWLFLSRDAGMNWNPVDSRLRARFAEDVVWSDPASLELTAILSGSGAWRLEIAP